MTDKKSTGIYFTKPSNGHPDIVDLKDVIDYAKGLKDVAIVWSSNEFPLIDPGNFAERIKKHNITRLIIAGDEPGFAKSFFSRAMVLAGREADCIYLAGFHEIGALKKSDTGTVKALIFCAVYNLPFEKSRVFREYSINPATLVIGGGIAGIQAALEIADAGQQVFLVEKSGTIGGYMATFDKTFPTLDCAACILTPKMVEVAQHPYITLLTCSEVKSVEGSPGNYKVGVLKKARKVNMSLCIGCGTCAEKCPVNVPSEFDSFTTMRKAIYIPFPQAVPNKYLIDAGHCTWYRNGKCGACVRFCPVPNAINFDEKDEELEINVGNIIVAIGYKPFDAGRDEHLGYGKYPNVVTSLEFERLLNASGPTGGNISFRTKDKKGNWVFKPGGDEIDSVAIIHCVGSRDENYNKYCSKVCCMYSLKLAHLVLERIPDANVYEYFIDMRAFGKGYEEFYERIKHEGVHIIRGRTAQIEEKDGKLVLRSEDILHGNLIEQTVDMVILAVGLEPRDEASELANMLGINQSSDGWLMESNYISDPVSTLKKGISIAGVCQGPKDIPDTVAQASAAASRVLQCILKGRITGSFKVEDPLKINQPS